MKILKTVAILSIAGIMATVAVNANEVNDHKPGIFKQMKKMRGIMKQLDLTKEQRVELKENRKNMRETMKAKRKEFKSSKNMGQFINMNGIDREGMINQATQRATLMAGLKADMMEKTLNILTTEQKTKYITLMKAK